MTRINKWLQRGPITTDAVPLPAPLSINFDYAADDSGALRLWAKGAYAAEGFLRACEAALQLRDGRVVSLTGLPVLHQHWRTVPADKETRARGVCDTLHVESEPGPGAYAVTVLEAWLPMHSQR